MQRVLGLTRDEAVVLMTRARHKLGRRGYLLRLVAFMLATAPLARQAIPAAFRVRAIRPFMYGLLPSPTENLYYVLPTASSLVEGD